MTNVAMHVGEAPPDLTGPYLLWMDTSHPANAILKYYDGTAGRWVRMDGGGDLMPGYIELHHLSDELKSRIMGETNG